MKARRGGAVQHAVRGLTMVEMVVVISVCAVLAALLVPAVFRSRSSARTVVCAGNLHGVGQALSLCVQETAGLLPDAYYIFNGHSGAYQVSVRLPQSAEPDAWMRPEPRKSLECPADETPISVAGRNMSGALVPVGSSYAYNVALPLLYRNASRLARPAETVTFYDGDLSVIAGAEWEYDQAWAQPTIRYRHRGEANFLFGDGHVEKAARYPGVGFAGGSEWLASARDTRTQSGASPVPPVGKAVGGKININPNNSPQASFTLTLPDGTTITRDDLNNDTPKLGPGFSSGKLEYTGPAVVVNVKPKGNGNQNGLTVDGVAYPLDNGKRYVISSQSMTVHLYNDHRDAKGKAMGKWWIEITAAGATVQEM